MEASADDLATIATSARAFHKIAAQSMALAKVLSAEKLNSKGKSKHLYKVGDKVTFYRPPSEKEAKTAGRKAKHIMQHRGPAVITHELSPNHTTFRLKYKGRTYERNVINMTPYNSDETPHLYELTLDQTVTAGSFIAALDDDEDKLYHIAEVITVINEQIKVHCWGTTTTNIAQAKWGPYGLSKEPTRSPGSDQKRLMLTNLSAQAHSALVTIKETRQCGLHIRGMPSVEAPHRKRLHTTKLVCIIKHGNSSAVG